MARHFDNWLKAYTEYCSFTESPEILHYWAGVSAIAGALGRRSWIDMVAFNWYPNFYIIFVGPPDVVRKTTTSGIAEEMLREVEGVKFGPNVATWQSIITDLDEAFEFMEMPNGEQKTINSMYICSGELGNFLDPTDKKAVDMLVTLWDGGRIEKSTKNNGKEHMDNTLLNLLGCTTPSWINGSIPTYLADGGLFSRMVFVYTNSRARRIAYPNLTARKDAYDYRNKLIEDLRDIRSIVGSVHMTKDAYEWGTCWYDDLCDKQESGEANTLLARKQVQLHKLAMIISASKKNLWNRQYSIDEDILCEAAVELDKLEPQRLAVFENIGKSQGSIKSDSILNIVKMKKKVLLTELYKLSIKDMPDFQEFSKYVISLQKAGLIEIIEAIDGSKFILCTE
jgi:hypothetical protein